MFVKSIRFKITILYMATLAVTLTSFSVILYHNVNAGLNSNMDTLLKSKAGGISQAINTYWEASNLETAASTEKTDIIRKRRNINFYRIAQKWVTEESRDPALLDIVVQLFDTDGQIISSSKNARGLADISRQNFITVLQGNSRFDTVTSGTQTGSMSFRVYTAPVFENEKVAYIVQVASPFTSMQIALSNLKLALFILLPITVLATGMIGAFLAKVTLRPVNSMIRTIHQITAENMNVKISVPATKDEIQKLAETFNDMLVRLEYAFTSQRQLFEDLSHELKTPLTILKGEFEVALKKIRPQEEYEGALRSALEEINTIIKLAENLLILARFDSDELTPEKKQLDLNLLIQGVVNNIKVLAELKKLNISVDSNETISVYADDAQLKTLFRNILDNAVKYTPQNGAIKVTIEREKNKVLVRIRDTGIGIPKEELVHIFDRFYRIDKSRNSAGFGLGLSIAKSIAESHKGTINVDSSPSEGTTFIVSLPLY